MFWACLSIRLIHLLSMSLPVLMFPHHGSWFEPFRPHDGMFIFFSHTIYAQLGRNLELLMVLSRKGMLMLSLTYICPLFNMFLISQRIYCLLVLIVLLTTMSLNGRITFFLLTMSFKTWIQGRWLAVVMRMVACTSSGQL